MPVTWSHAEDTAGGAAPLASARLWPYRSLPREGFAFCMGAFFCLILIPVIPLLGTPVLWGVLPFVMGAVWLLWTAIMRSYRDGELTETLTLWPDRIAVERLDPRKTPQRWECNPYWVRLAIHESDGPVPHYITLRGAGREVELGAFLSPGERKRLYRDLRGLLAGRGPVNLAAP